MLTFTRNAFFAASGLLISALGGFDMLLTSLIVFMAIDILTGFISAAVFGKSGKSATGQLTSRACFKGIMRKVCSLLLIIVAVFLDMLLNAGSLTRDAVIIALILNELISILENMGVMGIKMPAPIVNALEMLGKKK